MLAFPPRQIVWLHDPSGGLPGWLEWMSSVVLPVMSALIAGFSFWIALTLSRLNEHAATERKHPTLDLRLSASLRRIPAHRRYREAVLLEAELEVRNTCEDGVAPLGAWAWSRPVKYGLLEPHERVAIEPLQLKEEPIAGTAHDLMCRKGSHFLQPGESERYYLREILEHSYLFEHPALLVEAEVVAVPHQIVGFGTDHKRWRRRFGQSLAKLWRHPDRIPSFVRRWAEARDHWKKEWADYVVSTGEGVLSARHNRVLQSIDGSHVLIDPATSRIDKRTQELAPLLAETHFFTAERLVLADEKLLESRIPPRPPERLPAEHFLPH